MAAPFVGRSVRDYEEVVRAVSRDVLADALAEERFDFVDRVAKELPSRSCAGCSGCSGCPRMTRAC